MTLEELVNKYSNNLNSTDMVIWKYIFNHKKECCTYSIYELAKECNVSRTTILRFAQKLSLSGYSELKSMLKMERNQIGIEVINEVDTICKLYSRIINEVSRKDFNKINELIYNASNIFAYGTGTVQNNVIKEMKRLFLAGGDFIIDIGGTGEFAYVLEYVTKDDIVIIVSLNGETPEVIEFAKALRLREVSIISITKLKDNTLAALSDENIYISTLQFQLFSNYNHQMYESITSYYMVIELLFLKYQLFKRQKYSEIER
ncbi:MAG: hypothetical protein K0R09_3867 [Clostridiales bacterium]|nr:hypothetical protein [Clostridiales bacterium]